MTTPPSPVSDPRTRVLKAPRLDAVAALEARAQEAQRQADAIIAEAHAEAERIKAAAVVEGRKAAVRVVAACAAEIDADVARIKGRLPGLVMAGVRRVIMGFDDFKRAARAAAKAAESLPDKRPLTLKVGPERVEGVRAALAEIGAADSITVAPDPGRPDESSLLATPYGDLELDIDAQLEALEAALTAAQDTL